MTFVDHLFILIIAVMHPIAGYFSYNRLLRRIEAGEKIARASLYNMTIVGHWTLFAMALSIWLTAGRSLTALGFGLQVDARFLTGVLLTIVAIIALALQVRKVTLAETEELGKLRRQLGRVEAILPRNGNELGRFYGLSLTAGIVEEVLWRGFLIWYLGQFVPVWAAAAISAVGFGIAHAYQGAANVPRIIVVGALFAGLYLLTGSLWLPMLLHAAVDMLQGRAAYEIIQRADTGYLPPVDSVEA
jgi:membrane protease YdiL (CAAX protease family)